MFYKWLAVLAVLGALAIFLKIVSLIPWRVWWAECHTTARGLGAAVVSGIVIALVITILAACA